MSVPLLLAPAGILCGFLLMKRVPLLSDVQGHRTLPDRSVSIIIPARNEEKNLPRLLSSMPSLPAIREIIVVDDSSTDRTAEIARDFSARVVRPGEPPPGFTGKAWACARGAEAAGSSLLFFLDADTFFDQDGLRSVIAAFAETHPATALSILPFAVTQKPYEELSLFFNLMMAFGTGGWGASKHPRLFGQSLVLRKQLYETVGGHSSVGRFVLENFHLSERIKRSGGQCVCAGGRGQLGMRMFPEGFAQLCNGWMKAFSDGANSTDRLILILSVLWLSSLAMAGSAPFLEPASLRVPAFVLYGMAVGQVIFFARQIGSFRVLSCILFPLPLLFFFGLFSTSVIRRSMGRRTLWRGRKV